MKRGFAIVVLTALAAVAIWATVRSLQRPSGVMRAELSLRVAYHRRTDVLPGTPIVFDVYLTAAKGIPPIVVGRTGRPWETLVHLVDAHSRKPLSWAIVRLGSAESIVFASREDGASTVTEGTDAVAVVDHDHVHHLILATSPDTMDVVSPGTYEIRVMLESDRWPRWGWPGQLESAPVTVVVRGRNNATSQDDLERNRLAASAEFYLETKRFEEAREAAQKLSSREPRNAGAWMLIGDALDGLGRPGEALGAYRRAVAVSPRTYEEPTLLYERMGNVMRKLSR